jgi:hypothetical protein
MMADDTEKRLALAEKTIADLWKCVDRLFSYHGQQSPRWAHNKRVDMARYFEERRKAVAS